MMGILRTPPEQLNIVLFRSARVTRSVSGIPKPAQLGILIIPVTTLVFRWHALSEREVPRRRNGAQAS